jgi:hypothetical protein
MHQYIKISFVCFFGFIAISGILNLLLLTWLSYSVIIYLPKPVINLLSRTGLGEAAMSHGDFLRRDLDDFYNNNFIERKTGIFSERTWNGSRNTSVSRESLLTKISDRKVLMEQDICKGDNITLVILVFSNPSYVERRNVIRETWLSDVNSLQRYIFVVAKSDIQKEQKQLETESEEYKDIVQFDFSDSYRNLTYKTISSFKWVIKACARAAYVLKIDDDMWLNKRALSSVLARGSLGEAIGGSCMQGANPIRDPTNKYYIPWNVYPYTVYPTFCSGTAYIADIQVIKNIVKVSRDVPYFPLEDIYVAFCIMQLHIRVINLYGFNSIHVRANPCWLKSDWLITTHEFVPFELRIIWKTRCNGLNQIESDDFGLNPETGSSLAFKKQQISKLNMIQMFQRRARKNLRFRESRVNMKKRFLKFN